MLDKHNEDLGCYEFAAISVMKSAPTGNRCADVEVVSGQLVGLFPHRTVVHGCKSAAFMEKK